jgi:hypothetical protein
MFAALQWLLIWAAANLVMTWKQIPEISPSMWQWLPEMALFGGGVHTAIGLALSHLRAPRANTRDRTSLAALLVYNAGLIMLLFDFTWPGAITIAIGAAMLIAGFTTLFAGNRLAAVLTLLGCVMIIAAAGMRPYDTILFAGWRHALSGGCIGLMVAAALAFSATGNLAKNSDLTAFAIVGVLLFLLGVIARVAIEIFEALKFQIHKEALYGSIVEILGLALLVFVAFLGRSIRKKSGL